MRSARPVRPAVPSAVEPALRALLGDERVRADPAARTAFGIDAAALPRGRPDVVVFPRTTQEVAEILRLASEHRVPVVPRGAGTNLTGAATPQAGGVVLVLTGMDRMRPVDTDELQVVAQPGVTVATVRAAAAEHGLAYAPDPGAEATATIGGNVATGAGGLRALKYGSTADHVRALEAVLSTGEVVRCGAPGGPDATGYDLTRLLCGSEGTLAVITEVTVRLVPRPEATGAGVAYFPTLEAAGRAVAAILRSGASPSIVEFLDGTCLAAVDAFRPTAARLAAGALLVFGQDGDPRTVERDMGRLAACCAGHDALEVRVVSAREEVERLLEARRSTLPCLTRLGPLTVVEDVTVPRVRLAELVARIARVADEHGLLIATFGHAGAGNVHPTCVLDPDDGDALERAQAAFAEIFRVALELGGTMAGEHGVGLAKLPYLERRLGPAQAALLRRVKRAFDPAGILNPGKLGG